MFNIPNLFSLGNLLCGCIATLTVIEGNLLPAAFLVMLASVFDFLDGFAARGLKQGSPMGKELDSLADMVTFGVVPGMVMFQLIRFAVVLTPGMPGLLVSFLPYIGFMVPLFSGLRLAKFNVDTRQSETFIGLPTLANALFITGLPLLLGVDGDLFPKMFVLEKHPFLPVEWSWRDVTAPVLGLVMHSPFTFLVITIIFSFLLISPLPMFSFKVKSVKWKGNEMRYVFLLLSALLVLALRIKTLSVIILLYILLSAGKAVFARKDAAK